jgi:hypothetical protein
VKSIEAERYFLRVFTGQNLKSAGQTNERAMAKALELYDGRGKGSDLASAKGTAFGLLNAVTALKTTIQLFATFLSLSIRQRKMYAR